MNREIKQLLSCNTNENDCYGSFNKGLDICITLCGNSENCKLQSIRKVKKSSVVNKKKVLQVIGNKPGIKLKELINIFKESTSLSEERVRETIINILGTKVNISDSGGIALKNKN